jgi:hypothetical protein
MIFALFTRVLIELISENQFGLFGFVTDMFGKMGGNVKILWNIFEMLRSRKPTVKHIS